jgi:phenylpropionate dioxygenase-like ring-hydroxylating dioxygenase large terminal subunit
MNDLSRIVEKAEDLAGPTVLPIEACVSEDYVRLERDRLWRKVWLQVCRLEEIPEVGNFISYDILDDSILIVRQGEDKIAAFCNACSHRGRRLVDTPPGEKNTKGDKTHFVCGFHGWVTPRVYAVRRVQGVGPRPGAARQHRLRRADQVHRRHAGLHPAPQVLKHWLDSARGDESRRSDR